jgi:protein CpxP
LSRLHDELHLTADQAPAWSQYQAAMEQGAQMQVRHAATQRMLPQLQTPRRLALLDAAMSQDLADFRRQGQAVLAFYNSLTPAQQRTFDSEAMASGGQSR